MKKLLSVAAISLFSLCIWAQDTKGDKGEKGDKGSKDSQEIIIRKKGDKDSKIVVEIKGDKITINGKPLSEFKDDEITINRRNIIVRDRSGRSLYSLSPDVLDGFSGYWNDDHAANHAFLGVTTEKADGGAKITDISKESAAEKAGLKEGDIIIKLGDKSIDGPESLYDAVSERKPNDEMKITYKRDGKESSTTAKLGKRNSLGATAYSFSSPDGFARSYTIPKVNVNPKIEMWNDKNFGETYNYFDNVFPRQQKLGLKIQDTEEGKGVKVLDVEKDSPAEKAGLKKHDVVTEIGGEKVSNTDEARDRLHDNADKASYNIKANRGGNAMSFDIKIPKKLKTANL
jgi:serine protease Do